jgi:hypothetical protein
MNCAIVTKVYDGDENVFGSDFIQDRCLEYGLERLENASGENNVIAILKPLDEEAWKEHIDRVRTSCDGSIFVVPGYLDAMCLVCDPNEVIGMYGAPGVYAIAAYSVGVRGNEVLLVSKDRSKHPVSEEALRGVRFFWGMVEAMKSWYPKEFLGGYVKRCEEVVAVQRPWLSQPRPGGELPEMRFKRVTLNGADSLILLSEEASSDSEAEEDA